jgi:hypothetical protein
MNPYQVEREKYQQLLDKTSQQYNWLSAIRLILVLLVAILAYLYQTNKVEGALWGILAGVVVFALLVQRHQKLRHQKQFYKQLVQINDHELGALNGDHQPFDGGAAYIDPAHSYTFDLDVFGENSLFQTLNRTANALGSDCLAACFARLSAPPRMAATIPGDRTIECRSKGRVSAPFSLGRNAGQAASPRVAIFVLGADHRYPG